MPDDLIARLREDARGDKAYHELSDAAADEIERLRDALRELLQAADAHDAPAWNWESAEAVDYARAILGRVSIL